LERPIYFKPASELLAVGDTRGPGGLGWRLITFGGYCRADVGFSSALSWSFASETVMTSSLVSCFGTSELSAVGMLLDESEGRAGGLIARRHLGKSSVRKALDVEVAVSRI
jgi:hypothetical protein